MWDRNSSCWTRWQDLNASPSHVCWYQRRDSPCRLYVLIVAAHWGYCAVCVAGGGNAKRNGGGEGVHVWNECEQQRLPTPFHTSRESPHHPVDGGPRVQCGASPPQKTVVPPVWGTTVTWRRHRTFTRRPGHLLVVPEVRNWSLHLKCTSDV